ncbi:extracellular conserved serine-rich protein [Rutstroemia sp. NJR-2017a BBW]|nr:extracellular conserved serine-rich protein [Rutstroemia sp. NJR-2017a BBW]
MARYALALATLIAIAQAITITSPAKDGTWDLSKSQTITWTSVSTDPQVVDIYLAHMASNPPLNDQLFTNVDISKGSESISGLQLPTGEAYQINFVAPGKPEQILAQSQQLYRCVVFFHICFFHCLFILLLLELSCLIFLLRLVNCIRFQKLGAELNRHCIFHWLLIRLSFRHRNYHHHRHFLFGIQLGDWSRHQRERRKRKR